MATVNLKEQINILVKLQAIDTEIYNLNTEKKAKPEEIKVLENAFEDKKQHLAAMEKTYLDLQRQKKDYELELSSKEEAMKKSQGQLYQLKTNKEYQAMLKEIEGVRADASVIEDKILGAFDQLDKTKTDIDAEKKRLQEEEKALSEQKKKVQDMVKQIDGCLSQLDASRKQIISGVEKKLLAQYERILANRDSLAIVSVKDNSCNGCNMHVPPQVINLIKMYDSIVTCEICNRILYLPDEAV